MVCNGTHCGDCANWISDSRICGFKIYKYHHCKFDSHWAQSDPLEECHAPERFVKGTESCIDVEQKMREYNDQFGDMYGYEH